jgi:hypothetical protein
MGECIVIKHIRTVRVEVCGFWHQVRLIMLNLSSTMVQGRCGETWHFLRPPVHIDVAFGRTLMLKWFCSCGTDNILS